MRATALRRPTISQRARVGRQGWLRERTQGRYWCDLCQIGDAMFDSFCEALKSRTRHCMEEIEARTRVKGGVRLLAFGAGDRRVDTGLRVFGNPVWRLQRSGAFVCEVVPGESVLLIYEPEKTGE